MSHGRRIVMTLALVLARCGGSAGHGTADGGNADAGGGVPADMGDLSQTLAACHVDAPSYYVDPNGDDSATGPGAVWKTLQHAADQAMAGDTVIVRKGSYVGMNRYRK